MKHLIRKLSDEKTICGIDTVKIALGGKDGLSLNIRVVTCPKCIEKFKITKV